MGTLHLVRHGQASFGSADYDRLSPLGHQQCRHLGAHWRERGQGFDAVLIGRLRRHRESLAGIAEGLGPLPEAEVWPGLDEYRPEALVGALAPAELGDPLTPEGRRQHFRLLQQALLRWMQGDLQPEGQGPYAEFRAGVVAALDRVRHIVAEREAAGQTARVLIVSSGGPISTAVASVLDAPPAAAVALNLQLRNSALTEFGVRPHRHSLVSFNHLPHLDHPERSGMMTHA